MHNGKIIIAFPNCQYWGICSPLDSSRSGNNADTVSRTLAGGLQGGRGGSRALCPFLRVLEGSCRPVTGEMVQLLEQHKALTPKHKIPQRWLCFLAEFLGQIIEGCDYMKTRTKNYERQTELRGVTDTSVIDRNVDLSASRRQAGICVLSFSVRAVSVCAGGRG